MKYSTTVIVFLYGLQISVNMVAGIRVQEFFPSIKNNLTKVTWAHAVNDADKLEDTLANDDIMMIEADVVLGTTDDTSEVVPIMAHPPTTFSNLTLNQFMTKVSQHNEANNGTKKGAKLDFKSISALKDSIKIVTSHVNKASFPIWINADILPGPVNSTVTPINALEFFESTKALQKVVYSVGWTTEYGNDTKGAYDADQIEEMISALQGVTTEITFPVRAGLAAESLDEMQQLLKNVSRSTLTIWSSPDDEVNVENLNTLINAIGVQKVYIDVPKDLWDQIVIKPPPPPTGGSPSLRGAMTVGLVTAMAIFARLF